MAAVRQTFSLCGTLGRQMCRLQVTPLQAQNCKYFSSECMVKRSLGTCKTFGSGTKVATVAGGGDCCGEGGCGLQKALRVGGGGEWCGGDCECGA